MDQFSNLAGNVTRRAIWIARRTLTRFRVGSGQFERLPVVFANAIPKSGSTLLFNIARGLTLIGPFVDSRQPVIKPFEQGMPTPPSWIAAELGKLRPGDVRCGYLHATPLTMQAVLQPGWANLLAIRDPRDNIVSEIYYALDLHPDHALHEYLKSMDSMDDRIATLITGIADGPLKRVGVKARYERFLPWMARPEVHVIRFEQLIREPAAVLSGMLDFLETVGFESRLAREKAIEKLMTAMDPRRSATFRKGSAGDWRVHFSPSNKQLFKRETGDLLTILGYEANADWS